MTDQGKSADPEANMNDRFELGNQVVAAEAALRAKDKLTGCTSYVQRKLACGFNRAALILDILVDAGKITEPDENGERHWIKP